MSVSIIVRVPVPNKIQIAALISGKNGKNEGLKGRKLDLTKKF
jgi:hypothetical protein